MTDKMEIKNIISYRVPVKKDADKNNNIIKFRLKKDGSLVLSRIKYYEFKKNDGVLWCKIKDVEKALDRDVS